MDSKIKGHKEMAKRLVPEAVLIVILVSAFLFRVWLSAKSDFFSDSKSYFNLRQIESIRERGLPIIRDGLSYSGRTFSFVPGMHYLLAAVLLISGGLIGKSLLLKLALAAAEVTAALVGYLIVLETSMKKKAALISAFGIAFSPILIENTLNRISTYSLSVPINLLLIYLFIRSENSKRAAIGFIIALICAAFIDQLVLVTIIGLSVYVIIASSDGIEVGGGKKELIIFSVIFLIWFELIVFKEAILAHGWSILWGNIPPTILSRYFRNINMLLVIYRINALAFLGGAYVLYTNMLGDKKDSIYLFTGMIFTLLGMLWLKLIDFNSGLLGLGLMFTILFGYSFYMIDEYISKTKIAAARKAIILAIALLFIGTTFSAAYSSAIKSVEELPGRDELEALHFLRVLDKDGTIMSAPESGFYIEYFAEKPTVLDSDFLTIADAERRYEDVKQVYSTPYSIKAIELMEKYDARLIYLSKREIEEYSVSELQYKDDKCFEEVYNSSAVKIFMRRCGLVPVSAQTS